MAYGIILHVSGEVPIFGEIEELPGPADTIVTVSNPRSREGKDLHYLDAEVAQVIWPIEKLNFIEIMPSEDDEQIISFVRE
ncbi:MAG: hypothetical protein HN736_08020 [Anaerolineae bacterium]|jgi:hypothetical protein|nr:hypothetical protein [Anaerolineae bacterium]MBT3711821.1 hypothetical protein [Anaerolineae bacterium]MBT4312331.1 hypothetical protein [Anaerolineae bacterium]MBT4457355.1 hypothetical protein [Anaerolineae bacterium]MBT4842898.1 hypothetical protein [Anaerolineae bacterium]